MPDLTWNSSIQALYGKRKVKSVPALEAAGFKTLSDLLWILPLRVTRIPPPRSFDHICLGQIFQGHGKIVKVQTRPNFHARGKMGILLQNLTCLVQDLASKKTITLKWFNTYPSVRKKLEAAEVIRFQGEVTQFSGILQILNPDYETTKLSEVGFGANKKEELKIQYPTVSTISGSNVKKVFDKIPEQLWESIEETLPSSIVDRRKLLPLQDTFQTIHAKILPWDEERYEQARDRLIYEELYNEQVKIHVRKKDLAQLKGAKIRIEESQYDEIEELLPFQLTNAQKRTIREIRKDFASGRPLMRLIQGDVGCGKTAIAFFAAMMAIKKDFQVAFMCPTESLAFQHYLSLKEQIQDDSIKIDLLLGSQKAKEKREKVEGIANGSIHFVIGTHSLIQDSVQFKKLGLAIIDEQHKFGVNQRIKLMNKGEGTHCLIMTATPIPRSLSLTRYGDLDISVVDEMPSNRKGQKTRIVTANNFPKFLSFLKTRISLGEQAYIVVPAITESEQKDLMHLEHVFERFKKLFPNQTCEALHGQMNSQEKADVFHRYMKGEIDILIATSVVEVGINVTNATVMAILNPERFGLSSLHQLRGRVGRGEKPGFFFLICDQNISPQALKRLSVIEKTADGFEIAEEDLKIRGEGDLFGKDQSGRVTTRKVANIVNHYSTLVDAKNDIEEMLKKGDPQTLKLLDRYTNDHSVTATI